MSRLVFTQFLMKTTWHLTEQMSGNNSPSRAYVDAVDLTTTLGADSGSGSVATSQTLTISGTSNETTTSVSGQTITIGLPNTVNITTELDVPTIEVTDIQARDSTLGHHNHQFHWCCFGR